MCFATRRACAAVSRADMHMLMSLESPGEGVTHKSKIVQTLHLYIVSNDIQEVYHDFRRCSYYFQGFLSHLLGILLLGGFKKWVPKQARGYLRPEKKSPYPIFSGFAGTIRALRKSEKGRNRSGKAEFCLEGRADTLMCFALGVPPWGLSLV